MYFNILFVEFVFLIQSFISIFSNKVLDTSRDEDVFLFIVQNAFKLSIPFVERNEY